MIKSLLHCVKNRKGTAPPQKPYKKNYLRGCVVLTFRRIITYITFIALQQTIKNYFEGCIHSLANSYGRSNKGRSFCFKQTLLYCKLSLLDSVKSKTLLYRLVKTNKRNNLLILNYVCKIKGYIVFKAIY